MGAESPTASSPPLEAFRYVDSAIGGASKRNQVAEIATFAPPAGTRDVFTTVFRFTDDLLAYMLMNPNSKGEPSVSGYNGPAYAPRFVTDFDSARDLSAALCDGRALVRRLGDYEVPPSAIRAFFSGSKGFSFELSGAFFGGFEPMPARELAARFKRLAAVLGEGLATLDLSIYEPVRLWRVVNTINGKSGLYKIPLTIPELRKLDVDAIKALAARPRHIDAAPYLRSLE